MKGIDLNVYQHTILIRDDAKPIQQRPYTYDNTFSSKTKKEIYKSLVDVEFIYDIKHIKWVSPTVIVPKKEWKILSVCQP